MCPDPLLGECGKSRVHLGGYAQGLVVLRDQGERSFALLRRVEGARGEVGGGDRVPGDVPVDGFGGCVVRDPGSGPAVEAVRDELVFLVRIAWGEELHAMQGAPVAQTPDREGGERTRAYHDAGAKQLQGRTSGAPGAHDENPQVEADGEQQQSPIWPQEDAGGNGHAASKPRAGAALLQVVQTDDR